MLREPCSLLGDKSSQTPRLTKAHVDAAEFQREDIRCRQEVHETLLRLGLAQELRDVRVDFDDLVVLRRNWTNDAIFNTSGDDTVQNKAQDTELGLQQLTRSRAPALNEAFQIMPILQQSVDVRLHQRLIQLVVAEAPPNPHRTCMLQEVPHDGEVQIVPSHDRRQR